MKNLFFVKFQFILWSFLIFIGSASAKEIQCSLMLESNSYFVNVTPLSDQTYRAEIVVANNQNKMLNLLGQYMILNCCSLCNPNCQGSGLPACPIRPGSCH